MAQPFKVRVLELRIQSSLPELDHTNSLQSSQSTFNLYILLKRLTRLLVNIGTDLCGDQTPHLHTILSLTPPPASPPLSPPVIYIYIELEAVVESEWRQPRLIIMGDYRPTAPPLCRVITKRERVREEDGVLGRPDVRIHFI